LKSSEDRPKEARLSGHLFVQQVHYVERIHNNAARLSENKILKSLASGKLEWETDGLPTTSDLDGSYLPSEIALPISADAT